MYMYTYINVNTHTSTHAHHRLTEKKARCGLNSLSFVLPSHHISLVTATTAPQDMGVKVRLTDVVYKASNNDPTIPSQQVKGCTTVLLTTNGVRPCCALPWVITKGPKGLPRKKRFSVRTVKENPRERR